MSKKGKTSMLTMPRSRIFTMDIGVLGSRKHHIKALVEFDVTRPLNKIRAHNKSNSEKLSFTSWLLKCISISLENNRQAHGLRKSNTKIITFEDVDLSIVIEKKVGDTLVPLPYVLRETNKKTIFDLYEEIETVKNKTLSDKEIDMNNSGSAVAVFFSYLPRFVRLFIWKLLLRNPYRVKKMMGTSLVTSVGMFGNLSGWAIPYGIHPITFTVGSITKKPRVVADSIKIRDILPVTVLIDHDVIDGAPATRYLSALQELLESGHGLIADSASGDS